MMEISKKIMKEELPHWSTEEDVLQFLKNSNASKAMKDFYTIQLLEGLLARIGTLEECADELVADEQ